MSKARVRNTNGTIHLVNAFGEFSRTVGGETFAFVITADLSGVGYNVTLKSAGLRVCTIDDALDNAPATLTMRGMECLHRLADRIGVARARSVLAGARPLPEIKFVAGWNTPGCLPEEPFAEFDTFEQARKYIANELRIVRDDMLVQECLREAESCDKAIQWINRQSQPFSIGPINQYHYEVQATK